MCTFGRGKVLVAIVAQHQGFPGRGRQATTRGAGVTLIAQARGNLPPRAVVALALAGAVRSIVALGHRQCEA